MTTEEDCFASASAGDAQSDTPFFSVHRWLDSGDDSPSAKLFLMERPARPEPRQARELRRLKQRAQLSAPLEGSRKAAELSALVKFNLRRPPESLRSRDTSQSRYFCVFADCRAQMHADENAAINIGRKLLSAIDREKSRKKSAEV